MADARIRVELTAESAKNKLKEYERAKEKSNKKAAAAEKKLAKEKSHERKMERLRTQKERFQAVGGAFADPLSVVKGRAGAAINKRLSTGQRQGLDRAGAAIAVASSAFEAARSANDAAVVLGGGLKELGGIVGKFVGAPMVSVAETLKENVFDQAAKSMNAFKIAAESEVSFAKARIGLGPRALKDISEFAYAEGGRKLQIETREKELTGAMVAEIMKRMTGFGG